MRGPCILCLKPAEPLTEEHIFPEAAGGNIAKYILCKPCNDKLGHWVDAPYVDQKHIQLARVTYKIPGKRGNIPQPFSDTYSIDGFDSQLKVKLDKNFAPRVVRQAPKIWVTEDGEIGLSLSLDITDRKDIPKIIRTVLSRFFKSEAGIRLEWSDDKKESAIQRSIDGAHKIEPRSEQIQSPLHGSWTIELKALFTEYVKVIYEICYLEFGSAFIDSLSGERLRAFLTAQCCDEPEPWELIDMAKHLNIAPQVPPNLDDFIKHLTNGNPYTHHLAIVTPAGVVCSMLGMGAIFHIRDLVRTLGATDVATVYISSITEGKSGIFSLDELLVDHQ
ncbi:HNH endonuclease [Pseudomonas sp.]|uniref:HNH endonuclease n=1 Tax=Pseudomonas sp. TaxID=306 RepID=UPI002CE064B3|nr:HNH endonuclease [Pseudomonas sp.]HUE94003.1 HNH endonuclease [Pseudomonas sp.]